MKSKRKIGVILLSAVALIIGYKLWSYRYGFCLETVSFNSKDKIVELSMTRLLGKTIISNNDGKLPTYKSYAELRQARYDCCVLNPRDPEVPYPEINLMDFLLGYTNTLFFVGAEKSQNILILLQDSPATFANDRTFIVTNCGQYKYKPIW